MPSSTNWLNPGYAGKYSTMNTKIGMTFSGANSLIDLVVSPPLTHIIWGDYTKWCASLIYFPIDVTRRSTQTYLTVGGNDTDIPCYDINVYHDFGYTLGEFHYTGLYNDFRDYEPYTTFKVYLPFYGFVDIPIAEVMDDYIQFRLKVDFATGQAVYTIGANINSVSSPNAPFVIGTDDSLTRIISTHSFNIGTSIPIGQTGMADAIRNVSMSVVKGVATVAGAYAVSALGATGGTATHKEVTTVRNPKTGRQIRSGTVTREKTYDGSRYQKGRAINAAFDVATDTLANMSLKPSTDVPNNPFITDQSPRSIFLVWERAKVAEATPDYCALYGMPLGAVYQLDLVHGYTEVSAIHFEGSGFNSATNKEMALIEQAFTDGVILP